MPEFDLVTCGYSVVEGPTADSCGNIYFSNVHEGGVFRLDPSGTVSTVLARRRGVGGLCMHADGGLVMSGRDVMHLNGSTTRVLLDRDELGLLRDVPVGGFNDLCADWDGRVLVGPTRRIPPVAAAGGDTQGLMAAGEHALSELLLITGRHEYAVLYDDVRGVSNGIAVSADNSTIYHAESGAREIRVSRYVRGDQVEVTARWSTRSESGTPDGVALDVLGRLWVAMHGGGVVLCFSSAGDIVDRLEVPAPRVTNLCFAGPDLRELYVTTLDNALEPLARGSIFRTRAPVPGAPVPLARI